MGSITRKTDETREKILTKFLMEHYFDSCAKSIEEMDLQIKGVDVFADGINIDLKGQLGDRYLENPTNTFALELYTYNRAHNLMKGWFADDSKITDSYGFCWINKCESKTPFIPIEVEYLQVRVKDIKEALSNENISFDKIMKKAYNMIGKEEKYYLNGGLRLVSSPRLFEQPINLVVPKDFYHRIAEKHCIIHRDFGLKEV